MSSLGGSSSAGKRSRSASTVSQRLVDRQRRLGEPGDLLGSRHRRRRPTSSGPSTSVDVLGRLARGADDLLVALVADEQDVGSPRRRTAGLVVHLGHQRAGRVDRAQAALRRPPRGPTGRRRARRRRRSRPRAPRRSPRRRSRRVASRRRHHVLVVDDLLAHVDRGAVELERLLHRDHGPVDAGAVAARGGQQDASTVGVGRRSRRLGHLSMVRAPAHAATGRRPTAETCAARDLGRSSPSPYARWRATDRRVGRPARPGLGRGPGGPAQPPARGSAPSS